MQIISKESMIPLHVVVTLKLILHSWIRQKHQQANQTLHSQVPNLDQQVEKIQLQARTIFKFRIHVREPNLSNYLKILVKVIYR